MSNLLKYCAPLALLVSGSASALTIDLFDDPPGGIALTDTGANNNGGLFDEQGPFASILGGHRDLFIEKTAGGAIGTATIAVADNGFGDSTLQWSNSVGVQSVASVQWDGDDGSATLDPTGLGGLDLSGENAFVYRILESDLGFTFVLGAFTSATQFTTIALTANPVEFGLPQIEVIPFAFFSNPIFCLAANVQCGADDASPVDFSSIGALSVDFLSAGLANIDLQIDFAETVPEPTSLALLGAGILAAGGAARRRMKQQG